MSTAKFRAWRDRGVKMKCQTAAPGKGCPMGGEGATEHCRHRVIIAVGSNIEPEKNIRRAREILEKEQTLLGASRVIRTAPIGRIDQDDFRNGAFYIETDMGRPELKSYLKGVEDRLGRVRGIVGPHPMDLDITVWDGRIVHEDFYRYEYNRLPVAEIVEKFGLALTDEGEDRRELPE